MQKRQIYGPSPSLCGEILWFLGNKAREILNADRLDVQNFVAPPDRPKYHLHTCSYAHC